VFGHWLRALLEDVHGCYERDSEVLSRLFSIGSLRIKTGKNYPHTQTKSTPVGSSKVGPARTLRFSRHFPLSSKSDETAPDNNSTPSNSEQTIEYFILAPFLLLAFRRNTDGARRWTTTR